MTCSEKLSGYDVTNLQSVNKLNTHPKMLANHNRVYSYRPKGSLEKHQTW